MKRNISLITMSQGNPLVLKETFDSFWGVVDEIIFGDLCIFEDDRKLIESYQGLYDLKIIKYPFNYIFKNGFSSILNSLISKSKNDLCVYMNCGEIIDGDRDSILRIVNENPECNTFYFDHHEDKHHWYRLNSKSELSWQGFIHEECGDQEKFRPYHRPIFRMADLPKDNISSFKSRCYDFCKECVYFENYKKIVDRPKELGFTNPGWIKFATDNYQSFTDRLENKGDFYKAFVTGDFELLLKYIYKSPDFEKERLESSILIEYQNDKKFLL